MFRKHRVADLLMRKCLGNFYTRESVMQRQASETAAVLAGYRTSARGACFDEDMVLFVP